MRGAGPRAGTGTGGVRRIIVAAGPAEFVGYCASAGAGRPDAKIR